MGFFGLEILPIFPESHNKWDGQPFMQLSFCTLPSFQSLLHNFASNKRDLSDGSGGERKEQKNKEKVQIPLFIVIPPMGSSTPRLVWCARGRVDLGQGMGFNDIYENNQFNCNL